MRDDFTGSIPAKGQIEKLRLLLSTYQDGTGQLVFESERSLPGWRDFERSVALAFDGIAQESKSIFDVLVPIGENKYYGISCKMRQTLQTVERTGRVTVEVSNSAGKFWGILKVNGLDDYEAAPDVAGELLLNLVEQWYEEVSLERSGNVDVSQSFYLLLQWHRRSGRYQLFQFPVHLPDPKTLSWKVEGRRLVGCDDSGVIVEWYGHSGGQLKYYPFADKAIWASAVFRLEPLPKSELGYGLKRRVLEYFPDLWQRACTM
ncbi:MAG: hypothetical protein D6796_10240 [Caldilineae bacterium]|nr:MAG: hypothetical protein D6796_10240 [Caldilineae bacterium]